jgi:methyltransferase (TIGR00027 family)
MSPSNDRAHIENVSDTALWVASFRAQESEGPDALFHDPWATRLVGERGRRIAASMPYAKMMSWIMVVRTVAIDELVELAISRGVDTVVNLGAGLDTRPYRLRLPPTLRWIEVDFPHMIALKDRELAGEQAQCRLERVPLDLTQPDLRRAFFSSVGESSRKVLVITEGVIPYLTNDDARTLAQDLAAIKNFEFWIQDFRTGGFAQKLPRKWKRSLKEAPFRFSANDWFAFFGQSGWTADTLFYTSDVATRIKRPFPFMFSWALLGWIVSRKRREKMRLSSGYVLMKRS